MKLEGLISQSTSGLGLRFGLVAILPTAVLLLLLLLLHWSGAPHQPPDLALALSKAARLETAQGILLSLAILALAFVLHPFQVACVRLLEGYWGGSWLGRRLSALFIKNQDRRRARLQSALDKRLEAQAAPLADEATVRLGVRLRRFYPTRWALLPTSLGNVLRAAEEQAGKPYGLDIITLWPRLYALLPERMAALLDDQRNQLDVAARFCIMFILAAVTSAALLFRHGAWLLVPAAMAALAWLSYRGAITAALAYGTGLRTAVDLYRFELLKALHLPLPADDASEKENNRLLSDFFRQGAPIKIQYEHPSANK